MRESEEDGRSKLRKGRLCKTRAFVILDLLLLPLYFWSLSTFSYDINDCNEFEKGVNEGKEKWLRVRVR